ncbi:Na+/H+ antiporter 1 [Actinomadura madurae]|uniref:Na+/H+ antiporter 1 n=2 Tax=Actinomadura madurae TaxID=1993 RepID=A0A1I5EY07_9ACTN|nr:Na+/H+ antiporter 1 [Actinomadura madurae]SPT60126.1 Protein-disulfide isomerase [Actinomadura madurae]
MAPLMAAVAVAAVLFARALGAGGALLYAPAAVAAWLALLKSGVDPVVIGLAMGLLTYARPASRSDLEHEAAGRRGRYWHMHDLLLSHQGALQLADLRRYAAAPASRRSRP